MGEYFRLELGEISGEDDHITTRNISATNSWEITDGILLSEDRVCDEVIRSC